MTIKHHPDLSSLMSCAAGSQPEALAAVVSSHLAMCPECRREVGRMQEIGVALFDRLPPVAMEGSAPVSEARASEADTGLAYRAAPGSEAGGDVPLPLTSILGTHLDQVPWKRLAPGVWHYPIVLSEGASGDLRLIKVAPGKKLPEHGHQGEEMTLLLRGSYSDELGTFRVGDVADLDDEVEHRPVADEVEGCICLVGVERPARFKGLFARLVQPILGV